MWDKIKRFWYQEKRFNIKISPEVSPKNLFLQQFFAKWTWR